MLVREKKVDLLGGENQSFLRGGTVRLWDFLCYIPQGGNWKSAIFSDLREKPPKGLTKIIFWRFISLK